MELKKEITSHLIPAIIFFIVTLIFLWSKINIWGILALFAGTILGTFIIDIDHFIYCFVTRPDEPCSIIAKSQFAKKDFKGAFETVVQSHNQHHQLSFHSAVFIPIWAIFCLFIITSTPSFFAQSLVLAAYLHLLKDIWAEKNTKPENLKNWLFWQVKTPISLKTQNLYIYASTAAFILLLVIFLS